MKIFEIKRFKISNVLKISSGIFFYRPADEVFCRWVYFFVILGKRKFQQVLGFGSAISYEEYFFIGILAKAGFI